MPKPGKIAISFMFMTKLGLLLAWEKSMFFTEVALCFCSDLNM